MAFDTSQRAFGLGTMSIRQFALTLLAVQNSAEVLIMHYSRTMPTTNGSQYFISTAVFLNEVLKLTISLTLALFEIAMNPKSTETSTAIGLFGELGRAVFTGDSWKMAIPALLYTVQNSLQYVAVGNLGVVSFMATNQLKLASFAVSGTLLLGKQLDSRRWLSLLLLLVGVAIVQIPTGPTQQSVLSIKDLKHGMAFHEARSIWDLEEAGSNAAGRLSKRSATYEGIDEDFAAANPQVNPSLGFVAALAACIISGLASAAFERIHREPRGERATSIWIRNVQLSLYSMWPALFLGVLFKDGEHIAKAGFFSGYSWAVWVTIVLQAVGGMIVAVVNRYASTFSKTIATGGSVVICFLVTMFFVDTPISSLSIIGTALVVSAIYIFHTNPEDTKPRPPTIRVPEPEKTPKGDSGYFDLEASITLAKSPLRSEHVALSTSRPGTPTFERRHHLRTKSGELRMSKQI